MRGLPDLGYTGAFRRLPLPRLVRQLALAGTHRYPPRERRGLVVANLTGYLATLSSLSYAFTYAAEDYAALWTLVWGNVLSAALTATTPLFHRLGRSAAALWLAAVIFTTMFYFISVLGHDSGIQLNYIGAAALALMILGTERLKLALALAAAAVVMHLAAWFLYPEEEAAVIVEPAFLSRLYFISATNIMAIVFLLVWYALHLARTAEARTDALLFNILPVTIAERLREAPNEVIAERFEEATVLFADLTGFTGLAARLGPQKIVALLDDLFSAFDALAARHGVEKIKTIGDAYMAAAGVPAPRPGHAAAVADMALGMLGAADEVGKRHGETLRLHVGIASGPVMAGIIGRTRFSYDVWGDTVNLAARLEAWGKPGTIVVNAAVRDALARSHAFEPLGTAELKGIGVMDIFRLVERKSTDLPH
jgi:adenylate cyclase